MATYGTDDGIYGIGLFGTALYGRVSAEVSVTAPVQLTTLLTNPGINIFEIDVSEIILGTGLGATGSTGSVILTAFSNVIPSGVSATGSIGLPQVNKIKRVDTVSATALAGNVEVDVSEILEGTSATFSVNAAGLDIRSINLVPIDTSADATGSIGSVGCSVDVTLSGVAGSTQVPAVEPQVTEIVSGVSASGAIDSLTLSGKANHTLASVSATGSSGTVEPQVVERPVSVSIVGSISVPTLNITDVLGSALGTTSAGTIVASGVDNGIAVGDRDHRREVYVLPQKNRIVYVVSQVA